jgi:serine/threonine protein kinase
MIQKEHKHDKRVDLWSIGVLVYELCTGSSPFSCSLEDDALFVEKIKENIINVNYDTPPYLSQSCVNLISNLLKANPDERLTAEQILNHPWLTKKNDKSK